MRRDWQYTLTTTTIPIVAGTSDYSIASPAGGITFFKKPYSARITDVSPRMLEYVDRKIFDTMVPNQLFNRFAQSYTMFNMQDGGYVTVLGPPDVNCTLELRYYRLHAIPSSVTSGSLSATALDFPLQYWTAVLWAARAIYMGNRGGNQEQLAYWERKAQEAYRQAVADDGFPPDGSAGFRPATDGAFVYGPNSTIPWDL